MAVLRRPARPYSFLQHQLERRSPALPVDRLDEVINDLIEAVVSTQDALAEIRRDDGQLPAGSVGKTQLTGELLADITRSFDEKTEGMLTQVRDVITASRVDLREVDLRALDAERAAISAAQTLSAVNSLGQKAGGDVDDAIAAAAAAKISATQSQNSANWSEAQADNAEADKNEALAWAEFLGGPVVSGPDAPAYIAGSKYPHGLFYQPVRGYGGVGGLWSAKWWALEAQALVGFLSFYYLGGWDHPPSPGETNPVTGRTVPDPLSPGSLYYDTTTNELKVYTGDTWQTPFSLTGGLTSRFIYKTTAGQTQFSGVDLFGQTPAFGTTEQHDVHLNGVKLVRDDGSGTKGDYTVDPATDKLTLLFGATVNSVVQWDLLVAPDKLAPGAATIYKLQPLTPDGTTTTFTMQYSGPGGITNVNANKAAEIIISLDGVQQEPVTDYNASGSTLTFTIAPPASAKLWGVYFKPGGP